MNLKEILLSDVSHEAKLNAIVLLLDKEIFFIKEQVTVVEKLEGPKGEKGDRGEKGDQGEKGESGKDGLNGLDGKDGKDGKDGENGISIAQTKIDFDGSLIITLSNGQEINVGEVVGEKGEKGAAGMSGKDGEGFANVDGGFSNSIYGGTMPLDAGGA
jgi:hypothetical protein